MFSDSEFFAAVVHDLLLFIVLPVWSVIFFQSFLSFFFWGAVELLFYFIAVAASVQVLRNMFNMNICLSNQQG